MSNKRLLITGGAGCLGSNLVERYIPKGFDIAVLDNFSTGNFNSIETLPNSNIFEGTIADKYLVEKVISDFDPTYVINSAASYKDPNDWIEDTNTNIRGAINIASALEKGNVKKVINFQTALCYGTPTTNPIPVQHACNPITSYGVSKLAGEKYLMLAKIPIISLRLANICAPRLSIGPIPTFYKRLKEGQDCYCTNAVRDFLDIKDFFSLMDKILSDNKIYGIFNVSSGIGTSIREIYGYVAEYFGIEEKNIETISMTKDDMPHVVLDPTRTKKVFDWEPKIGLKEMITKQLKWYDENGVTKIFTHLKKV